MPEETGRFITFEGPEGSGKSTQAGRVVERLESMGSRVLAVREPGGTPTGEAIRDILQHDRSGEAICPETEALLFAASRAQLVRFRIQPALRDGAWVVCDRFADSTTAYQGYGREFGAAPMEAINAFATAGIVPDLTILLDLPVQDAWRRLARREASSGEGKDRIEREHATFHEKVRQGYLELAREHTDRFVTIDAGREPNVVWQDIWRTLEDRFQLPGG